MRYTGGIGLFILGLLSVLLLPVTRLAADTGWDRRFPSSTPAAIAVDASGDLYVAGNDWSKDLDGPMSSQHGWWIRKLDSRGTEDTVHWNKHFDFAKDGDNESGAAAIAVDAWGSVYVVGFSGTSGKMGSTDSWWIKKFSRDGVEDTVHWNKLIDDGSDHHEDRAKHAAVDGDGNLYVGGAAWADGFAWWLKKFSPEGVEFSKEWQKKPAGVGEVNKLSAMAIDPREGIYCAGSGGELSGHTDWWVKKFAFTGQEDSVHWNKRVAVGRTINDRAFAWAMEIDSAGNVYLAGSIFHDSGPSPWWIRKFDHNGGEIIPGWNKTSSEKGTSQSNILWLALDPADELYSAEVTFPEQAASSPAQRVLKFHADGREESVDTKVASLTELHFTSDGSVYGFADGDHEVLLRKVAADTSPGFRPGPGTVNDSKVRVRSEPLLSASTLTQLGTGTAVTVLGRSAVKVAVGSSSSWWYRVHSADGAEGWVYGAFVDLGG
jgi:hypothetical protein